MTAHSAPGSSARPDAGDRAGVASSYSCHVYEAGALEVLSGVNRGDALGAAGDLCLGDVYALSDTARPWQLLVQQLPAGACVATGSQIGKPGEPLTYEARLTFMAQDGALAELLLIALGAPKRQRHLVLPLSPVEPRLDYALIAATEAPAPGPLADVVSIAVTRGTRIARPDGSQCPVEMLRPGDLVLTRDNGPQPVRHVLSRTVQARGALAPVAIPRGALGNAGDLVVSQHQRLFLYQRGPERITDRAELLVRARDLVDGEIVTIRRGGYADYVSLVFDRHEVIYAECIPAESLLVNDLTRRQLPEDERAHLAREMPGVAQAPVRAAEPPGEAVAEALSGLLRTLRGG